MQDFETPSWLDRREYPFRPRHFETAEGVIHYIDEGSGPPLIWVHGTPSWSFEFRKLIGFFSSRYRCLALDHLGFGQSDKPPEADYRIQAHAHRFRMWVQHLQLEQAAGLVVHDVGGPIAMDWALQNPEAIGSIAIMNSWMWDFTDHPAFKKLRRILTMPWTPWLYRYLNFSPRVLIPQSFADASRLHTATHQHYRKPFPRPRDRHGPWGIARGLLKEQAFFEDLHQRSSALRQTAASLIWGRADPLLPDDFIDRWVAIWPHLSVASLKDCGHFPGEEQPQAVQKALDAFLS